MSSKQESSKDNGTDGLDNTNGETSKESYTIGHYVLGKALGEGTFGKVLLGTHKLTQEKVAVKVLEKSRIKDKKDVERISREIKILKQLHHPNVVQIYEIIETEKELYLVMEFVSDGELFDLIVQHQKLKEKTACKYFQELISGINYIHQLGICHRDLKPENLLVDYDKTLKIVDFGLSNLYVKDEALKTACGSPCYAAPEMIAGKRYNGLMSDLWSVGVVLYAMLCGYLPFEDQKTSDLYKKILSADYSLPDFLSPEAQDMIKQIFQTDPDKRITVEQIRLHPWYQINKPETISFHITPPEFQKQKPNIIKKGNKEFQIIQRPNLLNQKIISNLETQQGFNRESLLKSIKNNKHNHLTATYYLLLKKHMIRHLKPYTDAFMELKPYDSSHEAIKVENQRAIQQAPKVKLQSNEVKSALNTKNSKQTINKNFESIDHTKITGEVKYNDRDFKSNQISNQSESHQEKKQENVKIDFTNQTQQKFQEKKQQSQKQGGGKTAFHHRREQSANPHVSAKNEQTNIEMYQTQVEQYKKEKEIPKQVNERNSRWKTNKVESNETTERNGHKRAESYNINAKKKNDSYDILNESQKDEEKINLQYIQSKNIKHTNKGEKQELRAPSTGSNGSQPRVQAYQQINNSGSGSGTISISQSGAQRRYDSIEHQRQSQINKFLQSPTDQISSMMKINKSNYQTQNERYSKTKHNFTASQKENQRRQPETIDGLEAHNQITSNSSVPSNMIQASKTINEQNINIKNVLKTNNSSSIKQSQIRNSSNSNKNYMQETVSSNNESQEYYNQLQLQLAMLNKRKQILQEQNNQNDQSYVDSLNNEQQKVLLQMQKLQSNFNQTGNQQIQSANTGHRKSNSTMMNNMINLENQKVQNIKQDSQNIRHLIHQINNSNVANNNGQKQGQNNLQINGLQDTTQFNQNKQSNQKGGQPTALTMPSAPKSGNVLKLKPQVIKQSKSNQKHLDLNLGATQTSNAQNQKVIAAQQFQMQQQYASSQLQKKKQIAHTTKNMGNTQQIAHNFDIENDGHVQSVEKNGNKKVQNFVTTPSHISNHITNQSNLNKKQSEQSQITTNLSQNDYIQSLILEYEKQQSQHISHMQSSNNSQVKIIGTQSVSDKRGIIKVNNYKSAKLGNNVRKSSSHKEGTYDDKADKQYKDSINSSRRKSSKQQSNQTSQRRKTNNYKNEDNGYGSSIQNSTKFHTEDNRKYNDPKVNQILLAKQNSNQNSDNGVYQQAHSSMTQNNEINSSNQYQLEQNQINTNNRQPVNANKIKSGSSTLQPHSTVQHQSRKDPNIQSTMAQPRNNNFEQHDGYTRGRSANAHERDREVQQYNQNQNLMKMSIMSKYNQQPSTQSQQVKQVRNYSAPRDREAFDKSKIDQEIYKQQLLNQSVEISQNQKNNQRKVEQNKFDQININLGQIGQQNHNQKIHGHRHSMGNTADISNLMKTQGTLHQKHYSQIGPPNGHNYNNFDDENDRYYQSQIQSNSLTPNQYQQTKYQQIQNQNQNQTKTPSVQKRTDKRKQQQNYNYPQEGSSKPKRDERFVDKGVEGYRSNNPTRNTGQIKDHSKSHNADRIREPINVSLNVQTNIQQHLHQYVGPVNQYDGPVSQNGNITYVYKN